MRDDDLRRRLIDGNPWWRAVGGADPTAWVAHDVLLRDRARYDLGYRADVFEDLAGGPIGDGLVLLQGPRRVGKSVAMRDLIATLCARRDVDPRQLISIACDELRARDLHRVFAIGRELTRSVDATSPVRRVWLLDEVAQIAGWAAAMKNIRDGTLAGGDTVVATSSSWRRAEDVEGNLLAGRAGRTGGRRVRLLMPMSFREYVTVARPQLNQPDLVHLAELQDPKVERQLEELRFDIDDYDLAWQAYLTCGGFPRAVAAYERLGFVEEDYFRDMAAWLRRDVDPDAPAESIPLLLAGITARASNPLNQAAAAPELGYRSRDIFERRLHRLFASFAVLWCPQRNDHGAILAGSQAKLYLTDPALAWLPSTLRAGTSTPDFTTLTEQAIGNILARAIDRLEEGRWIDDDTIGYRRTESGKEIDLSPINVPSPAGATTTVPIECKWVDRGWRSQARPIEGKYHGGVLATKTILDMTHPAWAVPAPLVAMLLN